MAWRIVKQPNGLLARFSTVVDDFTHMDMTEAEAVDLCCDYLGRRDAREKVEKGLRDEPCPPFVVASGRNDGLDRWREALETIEAIHGTETRRKRELIDVS